MNKSGTDIQPFTPVRKVDDSIVEPIGYATFQNFRIAKFLINDEERVSLQEIGKILYPNTPNHIYKFYQRNEPSLSKYITLGKVTTVTGERNTMFINKEGLSKFLFLVKTPMGEQFRNNLFESVFETKSLVNSESVSLAPIVDKHDHIIDQHGCSLRFHSQEINSLQTAVQDLQIITSDFMNEGISVVKANDIQDRIRIIAWYRARLDNRKDILTEDWIHSYLDFKKKFKITKYSLLKNSDHNRAVRWLNLQKDNLYKKIQIKESSDRWRESNLNKN